MSCNTSSNTSACFHICSGKNGRSKEAQRISEEHQDLLKDLKAEEFARSLGGSDLPKSQGWRQLRAGYGWVPGRGWSPRPWYLWLQRCLKSGGRPNHPSYPSCKGFKLWLEEIIRNRCLTMFNIRNLCLTVSITVITVPKMCSSSLQQVEVNPGDVLMAMVGAHPRHGGRIFKVGWPYYLSIHAIHRLYSHI